MKKLLFLIAFFIVYCSLLIVPSFAATPSPTPKESQDVLSEQIQDLKEKIASRVAQLNLTERRGIIGTISEITQTQITLSDNKGDTRFVDVDELTKFASPSAKESFGISDLSKGSTIGVLGLYHKDTRRLLARFVQVKLIPKIIHGAVLARDSNEFTLNIVSEEGEETTVDVENVTKTLAYTKDGGLKKSGFTKIESGARIIVVGFPDKKAQERITASRILLFTEIPPSPNVSKLLNSKLIQSPTIEPTTNPTITPIPTIRRRSTIAPTP